MEKRKRNVNIIVAMVEENQGMGIEGQLPWKSKTDFARFVHLTSTCSDGKNRKNAVIMGRRVWESIPSRFRPLKDRVNVLLSRQMSHSPHEHVHLARSFEEALEYLDMDETIETIWILGGRELYEMALHSPRLHRLYVTWICAPFQTDIAFPPVDWKSFHLMEPLEEHIENDGLIIRFGVYEKVISSCVPCIL